MAKVKGDSVPIKKYKTKKGTEYMPYQYGPSQFPQAKKKKLDKSFKAGYG